MTLSQQDRSSPWHEGELRLQRSVGVAERLDDIGRRSVRDHLVEQHRAFYPQLPFIVLGVVDPQGDAWATLRANPPGFLSAPEPTRLHIALRPEPSDPADTGIADGAAIGMLGIELHTRRRNRLNGVVRHKNPAGFDVQVEQAFGNCPQYIQKRAFAFFRDPARPPGPAAIALTALDDRARAMIAQADAFFVASYAAAADGHRQVDVSHRGGKPGFVRVGKDGVLTIPDFAGNLFFNTLGNFLVNPKAGLVFVDFETGDLLQMTGEAEVILESPEIAAFQGAERLWRFRPRRVVHRPQGLPLHWAPMADGISPNALMTGSWDEAASRLKAAERATGWRPFRIARVVEESSTIRSLYLKPADDAGLVPHVAGQHLPIRIAPENIQRTYTLSVAPSDGVYRISVKRDGAVSQRLHALREGDLIEARAPAGAFTIDAGQPRPAALLAAGIGITPMLAMLRHLIYEGLRTRRIRPTWLFYAARSKTERAFDRELAALVDAADGAVHLVRILSDVAGATEGQDYDLPSRIDMRLLRAVLPFDDYDFYLCGPPGFMQGLYDALRQLNIADTRIHAEAFGPASLQRKPDQGEPAPPPLREPARTSVRVAFARSGKAAQWRPDSGSLLELAEANGLAPAFSCRVGTCGSCRTHVLGGAVTYATPPSAAHSDTDALICCAVPAQSQDGSLALDL
ncbi:MAG: pyridoxamine 5'-phosphate oxidase family protein [Acetobacteraceae bacterium]